MIVESNVYFELLVAVAPAPAAKSPILTAFQIIPFPVYIECCGPGTDVACIRCSRDGRMYVAAKGSLRIGA